MEDTKRTESSVFLSSCSSSNSRLSSCDFFINEKAKEQNNRFTYSYFSSADSSSQVMSADTNTLSSSLALSMDEEEKKNKNNSNSNERAIFETNNSDLLDMSFTCFSFTPDYFSGSSTSSCTFLTTQPNNKNIDNASHSNISSHFTSESSPYSSFNFEKIKNILEQNKREIENQRKSIDKIEQKLDELSDKMDIIMERIASFSSSPVVSCVGSTNNAVHRGQIVNPPIPRNHLMDKHARTSVHTNGIIISEKANFQQIEEKKRLEKEKLQAEAKRLEEEKKREEEEKKRKEEEENKRIQEEKRKALLDEKRKNILNHLICKSSPMLSKGSLFSDDSNEKKISLFDD